MILFHVGNVKVFHFANWSLADSSNFLGLLYRTYLKVFASLSITIASACSPSTVKLSNSQIDCSTTKSCKFLLSSSSNHIASSLAFSATFSCAENVFFPQAFNSDSSCVRSIAYLWRDWRLIFSICSSILSVSAGENGGRVLVLNGSDEIPSIINLVYVVYLGNEIKSFTPTISLNCDVITAASSYQRVNDMILPTFPKIAFLISSSNCEVYWFANIKDNLYFLASERIVAKDLVAKFWNSSIYR